MCEKMCRMCTVTRGTVTFRRKQTTCVRKEQLYAIIDDAESFDVMQNKTRCTMYGYNYCSLFPEITVFTMLSFMLLKF